MSQPDTLVRSAVRVVWAALPVRADAPAPKAVDTSSESEDALQIEGRQIEGRQIDRLEIEVPLQREPPLL